MSPEPLRLAAFVSPHGFGHAARSSAVMQATLDRVPARFEIFTTAPRWFFDESLRPNRPLGPSDPACFAWHEESVDVGFRQRSALHVDVPGTVEALRAFLPFDPTRVDALADRVRALGCRAVLCDIAPFGIAVAERARLPSVLVESFSWPWLYQPYLADAPELGDFARALEVWPSRASVHLQARPMCVPDPELEAVEPIARPPRVDRSTTRRSLGIPADVPLAVVTMGGYEENLPFLPGLAELDGIHFLVTGAHRTERVGALHLFDNTTALYMPDVLHAADGVVAKLGYGIVAEAWAEGIPFAHVTRPGFREMASLEAFADDHLAGFRLTDGTFSQGHWIRRLPELLAMERRPHGEGGAARAAEVLLEAAHTPTR